MTGITPTRTEARGIRHRAGTLRAVVALSLLVSAAVHAWLWWFDDFRLIEGIGPLFLVNVVTGAALAVAVLVWPHWLPVVGAIAFGAATLAAFVVSATVGLLGVNETWTGWSQVTAGLAEAVSVVAGVLVLAGER